MNGRNVFPSKKSGSCFWFHLDWPLNGCRIVFSISLSELQSTILSLRGVKTIFKLGGCSHRQISSHVLFPSLFLSITHQGEKKRRRRRRKVPAHPIPPERLPIRALMRFPFGEMLMIVTDRFHIRPLIVCLFF